jgi:hypothetical protein
MARWALTRTPEPYSAFRSSVYHLQSKKGSIYVSITIILIVLHAIYISESHQSNEKLLCGLVGVSYPYSYGLEIRSHKLHQQDLLTC